MNLVRSLARTGAVLLIAVSSAANATTLLDAADLAGGYVITAPGKYLLTEDVLWTAVSDDNAAITIDSVGPVDLNLGKHTLQQASTTSWKRNSAISIADGASNVTVYGGALQDFTGVGVHVKSNVNHVVLKDLELVATGKDSDYSVPGFSRPFSGGIFVEGSASAFTHDVVIDRVVIRDLDQNFPLVSGVGVGGENGITVVRATHLKILDSMVTGLRSNDAAACIFLGLTEDVEIKKFYGGDVLGERNSNGLDSMTQTFNPDGSTNLDRRNVRVLIQDTDFEDIRVEGPRGNEALGLELNGEDFTFRRVNISNVKNTAVTTGNRAIAFQVSNLGKGLIEHCNASDVANSGNRPDSRAGGFGVDRADEIVIRHCKAENIRNLATSSTGTVRAYGFRSQSDVPLPLRPRQHDNQFKNCTARDVASSFVGVNSYAAGFAVDSSINDLVDNCHSKDCGQGLVVIRDTMNAVISQNLFLKNGLGIRDLSNASPTPNTYDKNRVLNNDQQLDLGGNVNFLDNNVVKPAN